MQCYAIFNRAYDYEQHPIINIFMYTYINIDRPCARSSNTQLISSVANLQLHPIPLLFDPLLHTAQPLLHIQIIHDTIVQELQPIHRPPVTGPF